MFKRHDVAYHMSKMYLTTSLKLKPRCTAVNADVYRWLNGVAEMHTQILRKRAGVSKNGK
jgi:hypothetical protein